GDPVRRWRPAGPWGRATIGRHSLDVKDPGAGVHAGLAARPLAAYRRSKLPSPPRPAARRTPTLEGA
ncbi:MAG TPA: hypothetical protein VF832_07870, partial [Longimicrobiales bacterium]